MSSSGVSHLRNACIPLIKLRNQAADRVGEILSAIPGSKALVLSKDIAGPLGMVVEVSLLKANGVERFHELSDQPLTCDNKQVVYFIRPTLASITMVAAQFHAHRAQSTSPARLHYLYFIPRSTLLCEGSLVQLGVYGDMILGELPINVFPYDDDLLTMCLEDSLRDLLVVKDSSCLYYAAKALTYLETVFGKFPRITGKGDWSHRVAEIMSKIDKEDHTQSRDQDLAEPIISQLILFDRQSDMVTLLLHQFSYEGLLDETIGINNGYIEVDKKILQSKSRPGMTKIALNSNDVVYKEIRDKNFNDIKTTFKEKAASIQQTYEERHQAESISEMSSFMQKFKVVQKEHSSLQAHINLAEQISQMTRSSRFNRLLQCELNILSDSISSDDVDAYLEERIARRESITDDLRLLALRSIVDGGIRSKSFDHLRREFVQSYGYHHMLTLDNLEQAGILQRKVRSIRSMSSWFQSVKSTLRLLEPDEPPQGKDLFFPYFGYAPIIARILQQAAPDQGWKRLQDTLDYIPGKSFDFRFAPKSAKPHKDRKRVVLVFVIGGITFGEMAAIRRLSQTENHECEYIVASTSLVNGRSIAQSLIVDIDNRYDSNRALT